MWSGSRCASGETARMFVDIPTIVGEFWERVVVGFVGVLEMLHCDASVDAVFHDGSACLCGACGPLEKVCVCCT